MPQQTSDQVLKATDFFSSHVTDTSDQVSKAGDFFANSDEAKQFTAPPPGPPPDARSSWEVARDQYLAVNRGIVNGITSIPAGLSQLGNAVLHPSTIPELLGGAVDAINQPLDTVARGAASLATMPGGLTTNGIMPSRPIQAPSNNQWNQAAENMGANASALIGNEIMSKGLGQIAKKSPAPPHIAMAANMQSIVDGIAGDEIPRSDLGQVIQDAKNHYKIQGHDLANSLQKPFYDAIGPQQRHITYVDAMFDGTQSHDLTETRQTRTKSFNPDTNKASYDIKTKQRVIAPDAMHTGGVYIQETPPAGFGSLSLQDGPARAQAIQDTLDNYKQGQKLHDHIDADTDSQILDGVLKTNPDKAYTVLTQPNMTDAELGRTTSMLGPDVTRAMTGQITRDLFQNTIKKSLEVNPSTTGMNSGASSLLDQLNTVKNGFNVGDRLKTLMGDSQYQKFYDTAKIMATKSVPFPELIGNVGKLITKSLGGTSFGTGAVIQKLGSMMQSPEFSSNFREYTRAVGNADANRIAFYGGRIQSYANRTAPAMQGPTETPAQVRTRIMNSKPLPPPPG